MTPMLFLHMFLAILALFTVSTECDKLFGITIDRVFLGYSRGHTG